MSHTGNLQQYLLITMPEHYLILENFSCFFYLHKKYDMKCLCVKSMYNDFEAKVHDFGWTTQY